MTTAPEEWPWSSRHPALSGDGTHVAYERLHGSPPVGSILVRELASGGLPDVASVNDQGAPADSACLYPVISFDGSQVAFYSTSTNLTLPILDFHNVHNVYLRDRAAGRTVLISATLTGSVTQDGHCQYSSVSADGRFVAFLPYSSDPGATGGTAFSNALRLEFLP